ncbi:MAG TPA: hypothetical protein VKE93_12685 [Candidatus Angelobacter sp.]|nr:hypothetical protein [Candidatus Angelobacter sp.]
MKFSRRALFKTSLISLTIAAGMLAARAALPDWLRNIEAHSLMEAAIFRTVSLPSGTLTVRRPPSETVLALGDLIRQHPQQADLYSLKALEEESKLDFTAAEADWKLYLQNASDKSEAQLALADFYHRRHRPQDEINALSALGGMPSPASEKHTGVSEQRSWTAFERIFQVIDAQALSRSVFEEQYNAWLARYPQEKGLYGRYFDYLLAQKDFKAANELISRYHARFPDDQMFPTKTRALIAYRQGSVEQGLAIYDKDFQPLWPPELVKDYFDLLRETRSQRKFLDQARATLARNPDDLNAAARIFYYYQQQGNLQAAQQAITDYRVQKDIRHAAWTPQELYTAARLLDDVHLYPEAARYYYALYSSAGNDTSAAEKALAGLTGILLAAPEQQFAFGSGDLSMYRDIGTMDTGPGYLNGILSLILNTTDPAQNYSEEQQRAVPYFHRSRAAELLVLLDKRFPNAASRPALHAKMIEAYAGYGEDDAVIRTGREFMAAFPAAEERNQVALLMADSYARTGNRQEEFAIYDSMLQELARKAEGVPLGEYLREAPAPARNQAEPSPDNGEGEQSEDAAQPSRSQQPNQAAFTVSKAASERQHGVRSPEYQRVLDRYISRLVSLHQVPAALTVWRRELDRNPNDPGIYERFADFLDSNRLGTEEEAVYKRAIQQFPGTNWYHKLARWYLRQKKNQDLSALSQQVAKIFSGSELEHYLNDIGMPQQISLEVNLFAHERFPHNMTFVENLMSLYDTPGFRNPAAWEALLRQYWVEDEHLRNRFFEFLSRTGKLESELQGVRRTIAAKPDWTAETRSNPAAARFVAEAEFWRSNFEVGAPVILAVARQYPADFDLGRRASSIYRSLAYFDPKGTSLAVELESNLLKANPADRDTMARIGDIYSDREQFNQAALYWNQMPETEPGKPQSYEDAATVFWDYYFFDDALRLLNQGRSKLGDETLYCYQIGAIYENRHDYPKAVDEYIKGALADGENSQSRGRLLVLAARKSTRAFVDAATDKAVTSSKFDLPAIELRIAVLEAQQRKQDLPALLTAALDSSNSVEVLERIESIAREKSLESVRQHALERQAAISSDPIRRLELRYALVSFYEQKKDLGSAQKNLEALYRENPKILGVVRSTVDFYWRNKMQQRAIDVLLQAAKDAYPGLKTQFTYEAARKLSEVGQYDKARALLVTLLTDSPYNGEYMAAVADTYARAGDQAGLRDFYLDKIKFLQKSSLASDERKNRVATLRRGLIPALTALKDYPGGVDQYIEIINAYPEDAGLTTEAAFYAQRYQRKDQLLNFYSKTVVASPKDPRWAVVLARLQTNYEDFDAAIATYAQAIKIRPDRTDLLTSRAALLERLMRFDEAASDYSKLYELTYHDSHWMEKVAEVRARENKTDLVVEALRTAFIDGHPEAPGKYFTVAERLEGWGMLAPARTYAEKGIAAAGSDVLAGSENHNGARTYTRIMTRLRQQEAAYQKLQAGLEGAKQLPSLLQQVAKNGLEAVTNRELRDNLLRTRNEAARSGMAACMREMGATADRYFTPEEKLAFARSLEAKNSSLSRNDAFEFLLPAAQKAVIPELEAKLTYERLLSTPKSYSSPQELENLQVRRLKLFELGQQLERAATVLGRNSALGDLNRAEQIYKLAGRPDDELRVLEAMNAIRPLGGADQNRYFEILLAKHPQQLVQSAASGDAWGDAAANFIIAHGDTKLALAAVDARGSSEAPVWRPAYAALTGLYFDDKSPQIQNDFVVALVDETIGQKLDQKLDRRAALAGDTWFYYGSRYGEYLGVAHKGDAEDFLPAEMEHTPVRSAAYFSTALYYEDAGELNRAITDYQHVLELDANRIDVHNRLAGIYWKQKRNDAAVAEWKQALDMLKAETASNTPQTFWGDYSATVNSLASRKLLAQFQPDLLEILHSYVKAYGNYRLASLIQSTRLASATTNTDLALELSANASWRQSLLTQLVRPDSALKVEPEPIYHALLEGAQSQVQTSEGISRETAQSALANLQVQWLQYLYKTRQYDRARDELNALPQATRELQQSALIPLQIRLAAQAGGLDALLQSFRSDPEHAPASETLRKAATELQKAGDKQSSRKVLEFVFGREIENHNLNTANMLGLADIRIQAGDLQSGVALLRRMTLVVGNPFEAQDPAAALLVRNGHPAEAVSFLDELVKAIPWNPDYHVRLAQARIAANQDADAARKDLVSVASSTEVSYETRLSAAQSLTGAGADLGSKELNLIASGQQINSVEANQPFFFAARMKSAEGQPAPTRIILLRSALEDRPSGDAARVPLMKAAFDAGDYHLVIAAMKPYLENSMLGAAFSRRRMEDEDEDLALQDQDTTADETIRGLTNLSSQARAEVLRDVGQAFDKTGSPDEALTYLRNAYHVEPDSANKAQINREIRQISAMQRRRRTNLARQPVVQKDLEQEHIVHPRLVDQTTAKPAGPGDAASKGGVQ